MDAWMRHPILGDPSFDTFEKWGPTVHVSQPPYEWAVNGSLFRDPADSAWYYFAGLYPFGYGLDERDGKTDYCDFRIYKSADQGRSWQDLGWGFERGFRFDGYDTAADVHPDVVMAHDPDTKLYWLAYDWATNDLTWATAHHPTERRYDSGAALAYATSPEGPFTRLAKPIFGNYDISRNIGRFSRAYGTTLFKRQTDWLALTLCDSGEYFSWGLIGFTAPSPEGPWSPPVVLLTVDRPEYYPAPVEFHPCFAVGETVYAPATSIALNRNYQTLHAAPLEAAHDPSAWALATDGNAWHGRPLSDEAYGIWGQTYHGFVDDGRTFTVMYPARDERRFGTLSVARRPWDKPHSDGFTFSGHEGKSISPLMRAYQDFTLSARFVFTGTIELAWAYRGIVGAEVVTSGGRPADETLADYLALRLSGGNVQLVSVGRGGDEAVLDSGTYPQTPASDGQAVHVRLRVGNGCVDYEVNGAWRECALPPSKVVAGPLALIAHPFSVMTCDEFRVEGEAIPCVLRHNAVDALLGAGQRSADWTDAASLGLSCVSRKAVVRSPAGGPPASPAVAVYGKWNVIGKSIAIYAPKSPTLGVMRVVIDGQDHALVTLHAVQATPSANVYACDLPPGRHTVSVWAQQGEIALDVLEVAV